MMKNEGTNMCLTDTRAPIPVHDKHCTRGLVCAETDARSTIPRGPAEKGSFFETSQLPGGLISLQILRQFGYS